VGLLAVFVGESRVQGMHISKGRCTPLHLPLGQLSRTDSKGLRGCPYLMQHCC
jgi:hypothetical protein